MNSQDMAYDDEEVKEFQGGQSGGSETTWALEKPLCLEKRHSTTEEVQCEVGAGVTQLLVSVKEAPR